MLELIHYLSFLLQDPNMVLKPNFILFKFESIDPQLSI